MVFEESALVTGYILPIFAFLLVFIVIYALLFKTKVLGDHQAIMLFVSFILAGFFIVRAPIVEFIGFSSAWFSVLVVAIFFLIALLSFLPGKEPLEFLGKENWFSWVVLGIVTALFIISSSYIFNWTIRWGVIKGWLGSSWFGMVLLLIIAAAVSFIITKK